MHSPAICFVILSGLHFPLRASAVTSMVIEGLHMLRLKSTALQLPPTFYFKYVTWRRRVLQGKQS